MTIGTRSEGGLQSGFSKLLQTNGKKRKYKNKRKSKKNIFFKV
jgi:hypothetical protein